MTDEIIRTDDEIQAEVRDALFKAVQKMNNAKKRGFRTNFQIGPFDASNPKNNDAPYALMVLEMIKTVHKHVP